MSIDVPNWFAELFWGGDTDGNDCDAWERSGPLWLKLNDHIRAVIADEAAKAQQPKPEPGDVPEWFWKAIRDAIHFKVSNEAAMACAARVWRMLESEIAHRVELATNHEVRKCAERIEKVVADANRRVAEATAERDKRIAEDDNRHQSVIDSIKGQRHAWYCEIQVARGKCNCGMQLAAKDAEIERLKASHSDFATDMRRQIVNLEAELAECRKPVEDERSFFASDANNNVQEVVGVLRFRAERNARVAAERELDGLREAVNKYAMEVARSKRGDTESFYIMDGRGAESSSPTDAVLAAYRAEKAKGQP